MIFCWILHYLKHLDRCSADTPEQRVCGRCVEDDAAVALLAPEVELVVSHLVHERPVLVAGNAAAVEPVLLLQPRLGKKGTRAVLLIILW